MSSFVVSAMRYSAGLMLFTAELDSCFPQEVALVSRGRAPSPERAMSFSHQANGHDVFSVTAAIPELLEYALRVRGSSGAYWITPKGEEHGDLPHNWFICDPQTCGPAAVASADYRITALASFAEPPSPVLQIPEWVRDAVFYEIFPERFAHGEWSRDPSVLEKWGSKPGLQNFMGGNLQGIIDHLGYLTDLGVTAIYIAPIFASPSNHKYDTTDYFQVDPCFGDINLLRELVEQCHKRGLRVILDGVFNHCSVEHPFFLDVKRKGRESRYWNWFQVRRWPIPESFSGDMQASEWYDCWWGHYSLPKFNHKEPEVEKYFLNVATYWLNCTGIDGWRLDVPNEVVPSFWPKFRRAVKAANPEAYILGEIWDDPSAWLQGDKFDGVMNYQFQKALLSYFADEEMNTPALDRTLRELLGSCPNGSIFGMLNLIDSHDTVRASTRVLAGNGAKRKLETLKLMASLQFTYPGVPCIYYGDEIGLEGEKDPDSRRCYPWGWDHKDEGWRQELLNHYKKLIAIRKKNASLRHGDFRTIEAGARRDLYVFERSFHGNLCIIAINRSDEHQILALPKSVHTTDLLSGLKVEDDLVIVRARQMVAYELSEHSPEESFITTCLSPLFKRNGHSRNGSSARRSIAVS